ncbi:exocyst complex component SEC8-like [Hibiscus syriacus]|uniref:exocyst complex component SEC8-like n=1 Tax=Hibiscus syriacus TaxID=106335 RepID=UPI0019204417|nr:exocyst complex component SEC8-like [Hibiscus syriacus]XP_039042023.1 exocyst complex component SEC8-like [Hibiscus syriacus]
MGMFDGLPIPRDKENLRDELSGIDESWTAARFDSLPHVVRILTSKDREGELQIFKEQSDVVEDVVDEVVHAYHGGFNKAIQNYSQILRLFSESSESIGALKGDLTEAKKSLGVRNKQLHQLWYRSVTLRHIISLLDQIEGIAKVPARIEKLISDNQFYAAAQSLVQSALMLEREGLQMVGALQDVRSELSKLRSVLFYRVLEDLHAHLYNTGEYSSIAASMHEKDDEVPTTTAVAFTINTSHPVSRRTRSVRGDSMFGSQGLVDGPYRPGSIDGGSSYDDHDEDGYLEPHDNFGDAKDSKVISPQIPSWLSGSTPDEFVETIKKSDAPLHVKYLQTMVECLCLLNKVAAAGAVICQRLRPTIHEIITSKIKACAEFINSSRSGIDKATRIGNSSLHFIKGHVESYQLPKQKHQNGMSLAGTLVAVSPVSPVMAPTGKAQVVAKELLDSILETVVRIFENHVVVGELIQSKSTLQVDPNTQKSLSTNVNLDSEASQVTGGYSVGFSFTVLQSECQQLLCEILRATPEAASADATHTARLASKVPTNEKRDGSEDALTFAFRFTDASISVPIQGVDLVLQGLNKKGPNVSQEGYGSAAVLPEQGIYLAASLYRPVHQFTDKLASMLPKNYSQLGNDGLLAFVENFVKDRLLPTMFVDYRKSVQQAISSPAAFRPRAHPSVSYNSSIEKGRPVLQGLQAIDFLAKEVLGWAHAMPKFAAELVNFVQTFLERTFERCRTSYMEAVLEKQSYMVIGRHDIDKLMRLDPASVCLPNALGQSNVGTTVSDSESMEIESELSELLLNLRPIKQENLIRDDNKLVLLASLSDSLEYVVDSIERLVKATPLAALNHAESGKPRNKQTSSSPPRDLASFADEYRKLAIDCLKVMRVEMQLETIFHLQEMTYREYLENQDAEEPDDFIISLTAQITRRDEEIAPFVAGVKRNYIFGGICSIAANASLKALADMKSINLFGVQQICRNSIALEQALAAIPSIDSEAIQQRLDHVRTYFELLNMPFEALLSFITEHKHLFTVAEYANLLRVQVPGREIPPDAQDRVSEILSH